MGINARHEGVTVTRTTCTPTPLFCLAMLAGASTLAACGQSHSRYNSCATDADCGAGEECVEAEGQCYPAKDNPSGTPQAQSDCEGDSELGEGCLCNARKSCADGLFCSGGRCRTRDTARPDDGCSTHDDCEFGEYCASNGACVTCLNDTHCSEGVCRSDGTCGPQERCSSDADCAAAGKVCDPSSGNCVPCVIDGHCADGEICREFECVQDTGNGGGTDDGGGGAPTCSSQADCTPIGKVCDTSVGVCVDCESRDDASATFICPSDYTCSAGTCTPDSSGGGTPGDGGDDACTRAADCADGLVCNLSTGECEECIYDSQCEPLGQVCNAQTGRCEDPECTSNADCTGGEVCWSNTCTTCVADSECNSGEICGDDGLCQPEGGSSGGSTGCTSNADCTGGKICWNDTCTTCIADSECDSGEVCGNDGLCQPEGSSGGDGGSSGGSDGGGSTGCTSNAECTGGKVCWNNTCTTCIADSECDSGEICGNDGLCQPEGSSGGDGGSSGGTPTAALGDSCSDDSDCGSNLKCVSFGSGTSLCSRTCVGDGSTDDCPTDYKCVTNPQTLNTQNGTDKRPVFRMCKHESQASGSDTGYPFSTPVGGSCANDSNTCQSGVCGFEENGVCDSGCAANADCGAGQACWKYGSVKMICTQSLASLGQPGDSCSSASECDSGICAGACSSSGNYCTSDYDCASGETCEGQCFEPCRSNTNCGGDKPVCYPLPTRISSGGELRDYVNVCTRALFDGTASSGSSCSDHSECASEWCINGTCSEPCATAKDCSGALAGFECIPWSVDIPGTNQQQSWDLSACIDR